VLYGSRARGEARYDPDYDVAVFLRDMQDCIAELYRILVSTPFAIDAGKQIRCGTGLRAQRRAETMNLIISRSTARLALRGRPMPSPAARRCGQRRRQSRRSRPTSSCIHDKPMQWLNR
jgi:hypothetical protein